MKTFYRLFSKLFSMPKKADRVELTEQSFFDFSSGEKIKILRAAGKGAQEEQQKLLKAYETRFGQTT